MNTEIEYELILNHITIGESFQQNGKTFEEYKQMAYLFLNHKGKYLFEADIKNMYSKGKTLEEIFSWNKDRFVQGPNKEKKGKREKTWYDITSMETIEQEDHFFDFFFSCKLRQIDLLKIDNFLSFHLEQSFDSDKKKFFRFLNLILRKYEQKLFLPEIIETVRDWIKMAEVIQDLSGIEDEPKIPKSMMRRVAGDKKTCITAVQTAMLIEFLQKAGIILDGKNLSYTHAGEAFHLLTWYSSTAMRQQLGKSENIKHEDYKELYEAILKLVKLIEPHVLSK